MSTPEFWSELRNHPSFSTPIFLDRLEVSHAFLPLDSTVEARKHSHYSVCGYALIPKECITDGTHPLSTGKPRCPHCLNCLVAGYRPEAP